MIKSRRKLTENIQITKTIFLCFWWFKLIAVEPILGLHPRDEMAMLEY